MIKKQAPSTLINLVNSWCPFFQQLSNAMIAGGFIRSFYSGEAPRDMDLYFKSQADFNWARLYFDNKTNGWKLVAETEFALSYNDSSNRAVQLIRFVFGRAEEIIDAFDFTVCCALLSLASACNNDLGSPCIPGPFCEECQDKPKDKYYIFLHDDFFEHLASKVLVFTGSKMPLSSLKRAFKFVKRGYHICDENIIALSEAVTRSIDFDKEESIEQQIAGMDPEGGRRIRVID